MTDPSTRETTPPAPRPSRLDDYADRLAELTRTHRRRQLRPLLPFGQLNPAQPMETATLDGHRVLCFSSNDYLGYSLRAELREAAAQAALTYGVGVGASRLISGSTALSAELEHEIAEWKGTEAALLFPSGFQANQAILTALCDERDVIVADKLVHASLIDGMLASKARWVRYRHLDLADLEVKLRQVGDTARQLWVVTESVFSMDGDWPDLRSLGELCARYGAHVLVDEAHGVGVFGEAGQGLAAHQLATPWMTLQMGTFSKGLGGQGAYVAGPQVLIDWLVNHARGFIYTTGLATPLLAANRAAVQLVRRDPDSRAQLWQRITQLVTALRETPQLAGRLPARPDQGPILPILIGSDEQAVAVSQALWERGFYVPAIRPPTVPKGTARLRVCLSALHTPAAINQLATALIEVMDNS